MDDKEYELVIRLKDLSHIPEVTYKGEKITGRMKVNYNWESATNRCGGIHSILIKYFNKKEYFTDEIHETRDMLMPFKDEAKENK